MTELDRHIWKTSEAHPGPAIERGQAPWEYDAQMEQLIKLRAEQPEEFDGFSSYEHMKVGFYEQAKASAALAGKDVTR